MSPRSEQVARALNAQRKTFKAFLVARLGNAAEADDLLQHGLVQAMRHADRVPDEHLAPWFYRVLRNALIDHYRTRAAGRRRDEALGTLLARLGEDITDAPPRWEAQLCGCLGGVIATLRPPQAELLRRVDLKGESVQAAALALKLTPNNASVILHRARHELRLRLERFCGACAEGACLDCDCARTEKTP